MQYAVGGDDAVWSAALKAGSGKAPASVVIKRPTSASTPKDEGKAKGKSGFKRAAAGGGEGDGAGGGSGQKSGKKQRRTG